MRLFILRIYKKNVFVIHYYSLTLSKNRLFRFERGLAMIGFSTCLGSGLSSSRPKDLEKLKTITKRILSLSSSFSEISSCHFFYNDFFTELNIRILLYIKIFKNWLWVKKILISKIWFFKNMSFSGHYILRLLSIKSELSNWVNNLIKSIYL